MKIRYLKAWLQQLPLTRPYTIAYKTITDTEIVFFEIGLENGMVGLGASNPFAEVVGETPAQTLANLQHESLQELVGRDIRHYQQLLDEALILFPHQPGTVAAIDIALHDVFAQWLGIPVVELFGRKLDALPTSVTIGIKTVVEMLDDAAEYFARGFRVLKVKTGLHVDEDIERVAKLYERFGRNMRIRVDANQGYTMQQLQQFINKTIHLDIELIEQPLPAGTDKELLSLDENQRRKLCADESLLDERAAWQLSHPPAPFGIYNIKLMKCGGIRSARAIAQLASYAGIDIFWGCNDESMASIAAALHAAYSCSNTRYLDLDGSFDLSRDFVSGGFLLKDGYLHIGNKPGLGLQRSF